MNETTPTSIKPSGADKRENDDPRKGTVVLVVPCYNEEKRLEVDAFKECVRRYDTVRFLFVNDGSTDGTGRVLQDLNQENPAVFGVRELEENRGKAEAVRLGVLQAMERDPDFVGFWDADLATPLDELDSFLGQFRRRPELEMVFGARVKLLGRTVHRNPARHYLGRVFSTTVALLLDIPIYDSQCGAKLFRVTADLAEVFGEPFVSRWIFDVEILARAMAIRRRTDAPPITEVIHEQPLMTWKDVEGSKIRGRDFATVGLDLMRIYRRYL